ncbi:hypothetical protein EA772_16520 [Pedobacter sp. G11]|uniref:hypothetical protein n=1 Tax=Pedobacter sp. G11 TaxID=2482728 RepID=UPI000F5FC9C0|nr:hypothetical protein [Pedobacter sp. G11]AZI26861.1 hypothetical protein EA772_16520 [Pedobacter sp. G11]
MSKGIVNEHDGLMVDNTIVDCAHLIDLPASGGTFSHKFKGGVISNPKATIKILSIQYPKNGLTNLL